MCFIIRSVKIIFGRKFNKNPSPQAMLKPTTYFLNVSSIQINIAKEEKGISSQLHVFLKQVQDYQPPY